MSFQCPSPVLLCWMWLNPPAITCGNTWKALPTRNIQLSHVVQGFRFGVSHPQCCCSQQCRNWPASQILDSQGKSRHSSHISLWGQTYLCTWSSPGSLSGSVLKTGLPLECAGFEQHRPSELGVSCTVSLGEKWIFLDKSSIFVIDNITKNVIAIW